MVRAKELGEKANLTTEEEALAILNKPESLHSYIADAGQRALFDRATCKVSAGRQALTAQHGFAGLFGLIALFASNELDFLFFARWGLLLEAGWELKDYVERIMPAIFRLKVNFSLVIGILHHAALYVCIPVNIFLMSGPCGREVCIMVASHAGIIGPIGLMGFVKSTMDWSVKRDRIIAQSLTIFSHAINITCRGPVWTWTLYSVLMKLSDVGWPVYSLVLAGIAALSSVNAWMIVQMVKGIAKIFKARNSKDTELLKSVHMQVLDALGNEAAFDVENLNSPHAHWTVARTALHMGILKQGKQA